MRQAFEKACTMAGVPLESNDAIDQSMCARIAVAVQTLVERGSSDPDVIARCAVCKSKRIDSDPTQLSLPIE